MQIWLILEGEKSGPFPAYEIRSRIAAGTLESSTPAWHEGLDGWKPLEELPLFKSHFESLPEPARSSSEPTVAPGGELLAPPPLPSRPSLARRFWARWLDLHVYGGLWWFALWLAGRDIAETLQNQWVLATQYVPWFVMEALLIQRFATTPGKWLLGIRVLNDDGSHLSLREASTRSFRVLVIGIGLGWSLIAVFCQAISFVTARRIGRPIWDHMGNHQVAGQPLKPGRVAFMAILFFSALQLQVAVIMPHLAGQMAESFPGLREQMEKNPPWQLPRRTQ
jgi:uncharacterized RDD family membrane protein YckC